MNPFSLAGKKVLITGASSGIGRSIAIECAEMGAQLIITGRNTSRLNQTLKELKALDGAKHLAYTADLTDEGSVEDMMIDLPVLDGVVLSSGIQNRLPLKMINSEKLGHLMDSNFTAPALLIQKLYKKRLLAGGASLIFISSIASSYASLGNIMYMSSKGALNSYMKGIALELAPICIRANAIQPGMIKTNLTSTLEDETIQKDIANYPLGRYGKPEEVAYAAIYLLSDATRWMTGSVIVIDGGLTLK